MIAAGMWVRSWSGSPVGLQRGERLGQEPSVSLADRNGLAPLMADRPPGARFLLGHDTGTGLLLAAESGRFDDDIPAIPKWVAKRRVAHRGARDAVALIGVSQSGKSRAAQAAVNQWAGPAVILSVKADLLAPTWAGRKTLGEVKVLDPGEAIDDSTGRVSNTPYLLNNLG